MSGSHWDERYKDERAGSQPSAPDLPDDIFAQIEGISKAAMESDGPPTESEVDRAMRREQEKQDRLAQAEVDKWEAKQQDISIGDLREQRHEKIEEEAGYAPIPEVETNDGLLPVKDDGAPIGGPAEGGGGGAGGPGDQQDDVISIIKQIAQDISEIKGAVIGMADEEGHG